MNKMLIDSRANELLFKRKKKKIKVLIIQLARVLKRILFKLELKNNFKI